ncbi:MAG: helix-turn-helix transcriptional regulator [Bacillota bacterium]|jgi:predicted DNA-binding transcriptional regulator YafY
MSKNPRQKLKLIYLMKIFMEKTDGEHSLTMKEIIEELAKYGISAERKSIYDDIAALREYGLDIEAVRGKNSAYYVANRQFQLPELKLLVDAVQGSKFITHKKSNELIKKVESFASVYEAQLLQRQVYVANRIKTMNESIYYNIDTLHGAISANRQISFLYYEWALDFSGGEKIVRRLRKNGERYCLSPWALTWDDENYYLLAYDAEADVIKHFRVDKMNDIIVSDLLREGRQKFDSFDMAVYCNKIFGMFGGEEETVQMVCHNSLIGVIIDRFGKDIFISPADEEHFGIAVNVMVSPQFIGWLLGFGSGIKIISPEWVCEKIRAHTEDVLRQYNQD